MARKRTLKPDEKALWRKIAKSVTPLSKERLKALEEAEVFLHKTSVEKNNTKKHKPLLKQARHEGPAHRPPAVVDRGTERRMRRGGVQVDARIDLHGMTQDQAFSSLSRFLSSASARGDRTVLVITGKGLQLNKHEDALWTTRSEPGVLRRKLPEWLGYPELRPLVSGYASAHAKHGGSGAFYVTLRRVRD